MPTVTIQRAKQDLSRLITRARKGEDIIIARGKQPLVRLTPCSGKNRPRTPGRLRGKLRVGPEFFAPLAIDEMEAWQ